MPRAFNNHIPVGSIHKFGGSSAPSGYLLCDGSLLSTTTYAALFASIGYTYGGGGLTFNIPDSRGRTFVAAGTYTDTVSGAITRNLGQSLGAEKHLLTSSESGRPGGSFTSGGVSVSLDHSHTIPGSNSNVTGTGFAKQSVADNNNSSNGVSGANPGLDHNHSTTISSVDASLTHNNMQPSLVVNAIIRF